MKQRFHFVHFVLAEDEGDDQNTHRPSRASGAVGQLSSGCVKSRFNGRDQDSPMREGHL